MFIDVTGKPNQNNFHQSNPGTDNSISSTPATNFFEKKINLVQGANLLSGYMFSQHFVEIHR